MSAITSLVPAAARECAGSAGNNETWVYASMTREKTFSILLIGVVVLLIAAALAAMFRRPGAAAVLASSRPGNGKAAPAIKPDAIPRHSYRGQCIQCHRVVPAPAISSGAAPPSKHVGKGVCTNCHAILNPSALGNPGTLIGGPAAGNPGAAAGSFVCPGCAYVMFPRWRTPCYFVLCPKCGQRMTWSAL